MKIIITFLIISLFSFHVKAEMINAIANVYIYGEVKKPGIYKVPEGTRLTEIIKKAGGLKKTAWTKDINFAAPIKDSLSIYIPSEKDIKKEEKIIQQITFKDKNINSYKYRNKTRNNQKINLNTATLEELDSLPGIGKKLAQSIIDYRNKNGRFKSIHELKNIPKIGGKKFIKISKRVYI
ncbi:MAG: hypothetical protein KatS3mg068_0445 [Candidatus Sericytochromatia bacterium]|nr:MAG: hypothetical protein KatS3mg068_0445 [Candidatus Sericytochromatia bacterium]